MEKFCQKCRRVFEDLDYEVCPVCKIPLMEREGRIKLPKGVREQIFRRDGYTCQMCGASRDSGAKLELDHIIPVALGGSNDIDNLQTLCHECNQNKADLILPSGLKIDVEIKQNELNTLIRLLEENKSKLSNATDENEKIEYSFNIKHLEEQIPLVNKQLNELKRKYAEEKEKIRIEKDKRQKEDLLFKKLYVDLSTMEKIILKENFNLNDLSDENMLKTLSTKYSEKEIFAVIEDYKTDLHQFLNDSIRFNMLDLIASKLSLNDTSRQFIINHLYNNYTKTQIKNLFDSINNELFNQYDLSLNDLEKVLLKRHYSLNGVSDDELIKNVIKNDLSIDELKNTVELSYKNVFQEFYTKLDNNQKELVKFRFKNSKKNLVNFLVGINFSFKELLDELNKTKLEIFNKTYDSLNTNKKRLIERYSQIYHPNFDLINYFYENNFLDNKIDELIETSKKHLLEEVHDYLNSHEMFLLNNTFENDDDLIKFMVEHEFSFNSLRNKLNRTEKRLNKELDNNLNDKQKFLLKKYFSISANDDLITYLLNHEYSIEDSFKIATDYKKELFDEFDNTINYDYEQILYTKFSLTNNSKKDLIDYLIFEDYTVESMKSLIRNDVFERYNNVLDTNSISLLCYKFELVTPTKISNISLKDFLFDKDYTVYSINQSINVAKKKLYGELYDKVDYRAVGLLNKDLKLNKSKEEFISYLIENYTVESIRKLVKKYDILI